MLFKYTPTFVPQRIVIFGCGGTGSRVVPLVAQFLKSCPWVLEPEIMLVDFDSVEEKNLLRQNFVASDVGKNKAVVLASRYSKAFNISITPVVHRITSASLNRPTESMNLFLSFLEGTKSRDNIFIMCVDSPEARREVLEAIIFITRGNSNNLLIDSGNENDFGQVSFAQLALTELIAQDITVHQDTLEHDFLERAKVASPAVCNIPFIPLDIDYYWDMKATAAGSCAELDQTMAINCLMATNIFGIIQNMYYVKPMTYNRVDISLQHGAIPQHMTPDFFIRSLDFHMRRFKGVYKDTEEAFYHKNRHKMISDNCLSNITRRSLYKELDSAIFEQEKFFAMTNSVEVISAAEEISEAEEEARDTASTIA